MSTKSDEELDALREKHSLKAIRSGYKLFEGYTMPVSFEKIQKKIEDLEVYNDDVWLTSFPKSGTTWVQQMVWCLSKNNDVEAIAKGNKNLEFPFIEFCCVYEMDKLPHKAHCVWKSMEIVESLKRPRYIKTHLPWELLPKQIRTGERKPTIIHVMRNPMDVCLSFYHHHRFLESFTGDFDLFCELFLRSKVTWSPYTNNILSYWNKRNDFNIHFIKYEDMKEDLSAVVRRVAKILSVSLNDEQIAKLLHRLSFEEMKKAEKSESGGVLMANGLIREQGAFFRSGKTGGHKTAMTPEQISCFESECLTVLNINGLTL